jgi:hypothetical protein
MPVSVTTRIPRPDPRGRSGSGTVPFDHGRVGYSAPRIAGRPKCTSGRRQVQELYRLHRDDSPWQPTGNSQRFVSATLCAIARRTAGGIGASLPLTACQRISFKAKSSIRSKSLKSIAFDRSAP